MFFLSDGTTVLQKLGSTRYVVIVQYVTTQPVYCSILIASYDK